MTPKWLEWARQLQAISQSGLAYANDPFDTQRYQAIQKLAAEILAEFAQLEMSDLEVLFDKEEGYATPKVGVRGAVFRDDALLFVKERTDGCWTLPGGFADVNASPQESVVSEIQQESGYLTRATKLLGVYDTNKHRHTPQPFHYYLLFFRCELIGGDSKTSVETEEVGFFREDEIPPLSLPRVTPGQIARIFEHYRQPDLPTDFD